MNFKQVLIILLVVLYLIYTNMFYVKMLFPMKSKKMTEKATSAVVSATTAPVTTAPVATTASPATTSPTTTAPAKVAAMMSSNGEDYTENEESFEEPFEESYEEPYARENYIADWGENAMKEKQQLKECLNLKDDKDSSIVNWAARQEYLAKGVCDTSKFCPCKRDEMIV